MTVVPGLPESAAFKVVPDPEVVPGMVTVECVLVGLCATDRDLMARTSADAAELIIGHESLGRVVSSDSQEFPVNSRVVGMIRRPCRPACRECGSGAIDRCSREPASERGIHGLDGFGSQYWCSEPQYLVRADGIGDGGVLVEPSSSVVKGLRRLSERGGARAPEHALVVGCGTLGLIAIWLLSRLGIAVHAVDLRADVRVELAEALGATVYRGPLDSSRRFDVVVDCSGDAAAVVSALGVVRTGGAMLVLGIPPARGVTVAMPEEAVRRMVLGDMVLVGSVNASRSDYVAAAAALAEAPEYLVRSLLTHEVEPDRWAAAVAAKEGRIKTVVRFR